MNRKEPTDEALLRQLSGDAELDLDDVSIDEAERQRAWLASFKLRGDEGREADMVKQIVERSLSLRARRRRVASLTIPSQALSWARPVLAAAALLVAGTWTLAAVRGGADTASTTTLATSAPAGTGAVADTGTHAEATLSPGARVAVWAEQDAAPDPATILLVFAEGASDVP